MLSILIPTYNYSVTSLADKLCKMAESIQDNIEIIVLDDCSTDSNIHRENASLASKIHYIYLTENKGRTHARNHLANLAMYDNLLFLDADVLPRDEDFLKAFLAYAKKNTEVACGGIMYLDTLKNTGKSLRYKYGKERESRTVTERTRNPYLSVISGAFLIKKKLFQAISMPTENTYGMDVLFAHALATKKASVVHFDNPVYHLGLENNEQFIQKTLKGLVTLSNLEKQGDIPHDYRPIQRMANKVKASKSEGIFLQIIKRTESSILKNLKSRNPSLKIFDVFRLYHFLKARREHA